jgi:squalene-associated FAD-dependent desaturase
MASSEIVPSERKSLHVAIIGGGLAGLAAGCALADAGCRISLYERRPYLGGRASSYQHPGTGEVVDNCQHVLLGCCTNLIDLYRRTGVEDKIRWYEELTFLEPGGRASHIRPSFLPAPLHNGPSFLGAHCLSFRDKLSIARVMMALLKAVPADNGQSFLAWLERYGPTTVAVERFWKPILISALNEDLDRVSVFYAGQVIRESFMKSANAGRMGIPTIPLSDLYAAGAEYIQARGGEVFLRATVDAVTVEEAGVRLRTPQGEFVSEGVILAVTSDAAAKLFPEVLQPEANTSEGRRGACPYMGSGGLETSPIAGIHLWFDRQISDLDHAVLLDRTIQWMFHKSRIQAEVRGGNNVVGSGVGSYVELVVSSAKTLVNLSKNDIVELALRELREFFPAARAAQLVKSTVIKEIHATFSPGPGVDRFRPPQATASERVFLAGDWTATGWPATMEGAVRSGYRAAEAVIQAAGLKATRLLVADLPAAGLMRLFG